MSYQLDPKNFMFGTAFREGIQQSQDNKRRNALLDLEKQQFDLNAQRVGMERTRLDQSAEEMRRAQEREAIGRRALMKDPSLLQEWGIDVDPNDPEDVAAAEGIFSQIAQAYGGFEAARPSEQSQFTLSQGQTRYGPNGEVLASVPAAPEKPQDPGYSEGAGINPATGKPEKYLRDRWGKITWLGVSPIPAASPNAADDAAQATDIDRVLAQMGPELEAAAGQATGVVAALEKGADALLGQFTSGQIAPSTQTAAQQLRLFNQLAMTAIINNPRFPVAEQETVRKLLPSGRALQNPTTAVEDLKELKRFLETKRQSFAPSSVAPFPQPQPQRGAGRPIGTSHRKLWRKP